MRKFMFAAAGALASLLGASAATVESKVDFDLDFKDATISYTISDGKTTTSYTDVPVTSLAGNKVVVTNVTMKLGDLTFILCNKADATTPVGDVAILYSEETGSLVTSNEYKEDMGSYLMTQTINNIYWRLNPPGSADNTSFVSFAITAPEGTQPIPLAQWPPSNKVNGAFSWEDKNVRTVVNWTRYNNNPVYQVTLPNMGKKQESYPAALKSFSMKNIKGSYATSSEVCTTFAEVRALDNGAEFKFTGEAYVTWRDENELWLRDSEGAGMYFNNAGDVAADVTNGYKLTDSFMATYAKYYVEYHFNQSNYERDICSFAAGSVPKFEKGTEPQYPQTVTANDVNEFPQQVFNTIVRIFPQTFDGQYVTMEGKYLNDLNDFDVPLIGNFLNVGTDEKPEIIVLDLGYIKGPVYNPYDTTGSTYEWYPDSDKALPEKGQNLTVQGLVMRNPGPDSTDSKGGELFVTYMYGKTIPTGIDDVLTSDDPEAPAVYYDLMGRRVANPGQGIYLRRQGDSVVKVRL